MPHSAFPAFEPQLGSLVDSDQAAGSAEPGPTTGGNVYQPGRDSVIVEWPGVGALRGLGSVRAALGWETEGRVGTVTVPAVRAGR